MRRAVIVTVGLVLAVARTSATDQWPSFRGPNAGVVADDPSLPDTWSPTENIVWKADIPGLSWSSPVVWDDHIIVTSAISAGQEATPEKGLYRSRRPARQDTVHVREPVDGLRHRLRDRKDPLVA